MSNSYAIDNDGNGRVYESGLLVAEFKNVSGIQDLIGRYKESKTGGSGQ